MAEQPIRGKILLVDDEPVNISLLERILNKDHDLVSCHSAREAQEILAREHIDLILLDVMMPEMDGYTLCRKLKEDPDTRQIPVIFISALTKMGDEAKGLEAGGIDYITKPVSAPIVRARVRNHLTLKHYQDWLENLATLDGLTGVANRWKFDELLTLEWRRAQRVGESLSVILCDIDFFKQFNDNYGHLAGDDCLVKVASAMTGALRRATDTLARYGGEEFVILLPGTNEKGALEVAELTLEAVRNLNIPHLFSEADQRVTISMGTATTSPGKNGTALALLETADEALYEAKDSGRNRIVQKTLKEG